jgi:hypothetical protein
MPAVSQITRSRLFAHFCDGQHKIAVIQQKKGPTARIRIDGHTFSATRKVPQFPAETWNYVEEFKHGTGQSQIKPQLGLPFPGKAVRDPRRPFL